MLKISALKSPAARYVIAATIGVVGVTCFAPFSLFWLAPLVWLGLFVLLRHAETPHQGLLTGLAFGQGFFLTGVSWVFVSLSVFGGMPWWLAGPAAFLFCSVMALFPMFAGYLFKRWQPAAFWRQALLFAALIAVADWIKSWIFTGFPWLTVGYSQAAPSPLAGFAPLLGVHGLSLLVALSGALLVRWRVGLPVVASLALGGFGLQQLAWTKPVGEPISVALVQGNIPQEMKFRPEAFFRTLDLYRELIRENPAQLTVLPETAIPVFLDQIPTDYLDELKTLAKRQNGDLIVGTLTGVGEHYFNSAISLGTSPLQVYSKSHLVPFGEFIPAGFAWFMAYANIPMSSFTRGPEVQTPLAVAGQHVAANICYEDVFGEEIIRALPQAGILANLSNTAWFGHSLAQPQHLQIAQMRAAETGRPMLRATNTGMTAIVNADGRVQAALEPFTTAVLKGEVRAYEGTTPYVLVGNWLALGLMAGLGLLGLAGTRRRRLDGLTPDCSTVCREGTRMTDSANRDVESMAQALVDDAQHYVESVSALMGRHESRAVDDIVSASGVKLVARGMKIDKHLREKLLGHQLSGATLEKNLAIAGSVTPESLAFDINHLIDDDVWLKQLAAKSGDPNAIRHGTSRLALQQEILFRLTVAR